VYPDDAAGYVTGDTKYIWKDYTAYPESFENAEKPANFKYTLDNDGVTITGYTGDETEVIIPEEIGGISVYKIGDSAFSGKSKLTSVTIPGSITAIGNSAFNNCDGLTSITIPANVTSIGDSAFYNCDGLTTAYFKHDNGNNVELGQNAFPGTGFQIIYPAGAEKFADNNYNWKGYPAYPDGFVMPESDFTIRYENDGITITGYKGEAAEIEIPSEIDGRPVLKIGDSAFSGKSNLTSVTIPASVTDIGNYAFQSCSGLTSIELPENLTTIGSCAFEYCSGLTSIEIPDGVTTIESYTFDNSGLTSVTIPDSVTTIGSYAFQSCPNLTSVTIPNSVERIGSSAFAYCNNLESAHFEHADASKITLEGYVFGSAASSFRITYPKGAANFEPNHDYKWYGYRAYPADFSVPDVDNGGNLKYPEGEDEIKNFSFIFENSGVTITGYDGEAADVIIPEAIAGRTVLKIAYNAFDSELKNMKSVTIHASITDIASYAFYNCPDLRTVNLLHKDSSAITTLTSTSFARTARGFHLVLTEEFAAALGEGVYTWNEYTAYSSAIDDKIPEDIEISFIDASNAILTAYTGNAEKYTIPETIPDSDIKITQIGASAFEGNKNLVSVTIPASITAIGDYAFRNCSNLKTACLKHDNSESLSLGADVFRG
jgi:hypothetical protein